MTETRIINVMDYESVKGLIIPVLENLKNVREDAYRVTWIRDMVVSFRIPLGKEASVVVTEKMVDAWRWQIEPGQVYADARDNLEVKVVSLCDMLGILTGEEAFGFTPAWILTTERMIQGAAAILRPEGLEEISEKLGCDLVLLPSSIHEWIVIKAVPGEDLSDQIAMVKAINADVVEPQDRLSDEVLVYEAWTGSIIPAEEYR